MSRRALVCALMPEDDRDSGSRRVLHLVDGLRSDGWVVTFVSQHANPNPRYVRALQQRGIDVYSGATSWMDQLIATGAYDLVAMGLWDIAEPYVARIRAKSPHARIVVDSIDLHFLRRARQMFRAGEAGGVGALDGEYASAMIRELNTYAAVDGVLAVSRKEADLINDLTGEAALAFEVPDGEDIPASTVPCAERQGMVFVGCYRFAPNVRAVEYLCREILPRLDAELAARHPVYIVGDGLDDTVRAFGAGLPHVRMVGWVPSVTPYLDRARVSVVPLLFGAGTKRKVLHSLMQGTPTVSTTIGAEGLDLVDGRHVLVADDPQTFADRLSRLLVDDDLWEGLRQEGRAHIAARHGRDGARMKLSAAIETVLAKTPKRGTALKQPSTTPVALSRQEYTGLVERVRQAVETSVPADSTVVVFSKGDNALVDFGGRRARHYPQNERGEYAGHYPADSEQAIDQLKRVSGGPAHVVIPATAFWWLDHYAGLRAHFDRTCEIVLDDPETCRIYRLEAGVDVSAVTLPPAEPIDVPENPAARLIAFLLPQFHPIPENDAWWGQGFTEWTNVTKARPLFPDHDQPRLPKDLGFYDLRTPEVRAAQAAMAAAYGLHGFCYYHYWFNGKQLLERPFDEVLRTGEPDFPFCLCWANEPWTRRWDGRAKDVLQPQSYDRDDDRAHIQWLLPALADPRAITIGNRPVFMVYQAKDLPDPARTVDIWREAVLKAGLPDLYLIACETGWDAGWDATSVGFNAKLLFQPQFAMLFGSGTQLTTGASEKLRVFDYQRAWKALAAPAPVAYRRFDTVCPSWDNTARAGERGVVLHGSTPEAYGRWLSQTVAKAMRHPEESRIVFINAWNEWAEGCHLEPDQRHGRAYLEETRRVVLASRSLAAAAPNSAALVEARS